MVKLRCLMCGSTFEANLLGIDWQFGCGDCCTMFLSEVIEISEHEIDSLKNYIHSGLQSVKFPENSVIFSIHDPLYEPHQLENTLPLMCLIADHVVLDNPHALLGCSKEFINMVYNLVDENLIKLCDFSARFRPMYDDEIFEGRVDNIWLPFEIPLRNNKSTMNCLYALKNLSTYITTVDLNRLYKLTSLISIRKIYKQIMKLGYQYPGYDMLNLNFNSINYATLIASELSTDLIFNETRMGLMHLKYAELDPAQKKVKVLKHLMKERYLRLPPLNAEIILELRESEQIDELKYILNKLIKKKDRKSTTELALILKSYDNAVDGYNKQMEGKNYKGSVILSGFVATLGGFIGGPLGAMLGGVGSSLSSVGFEYFVKKYFSKKKTNWPLLFLKEEKTNNVHSHRGDSGASAP